MNIKMLAQQSALVLVAQAMVETLARRPRLLRKIEQRARKAGRLHPHPLVLFYIEEAFEDERRTHEGARPRSGRRPHP